MKLTLKALRANADMSQQDVANKLGIATSTWMNWEKGRTFPNVKEIKKIESLFNVGYNDIIFKPSITV